MAKIPAVGIDLGTTYSCVAAWYNGQIRVISNEQGNTTTPSYVAFTSDSRLFGEAAKNQVAKNSKNTVYDSKRLIGRKYDDPKINVDLKNWSFSVVKDGDNNPKIEVQFLEKTALFTPEEISSMILVKMKETAERYLRGPVKDAVITVPAYFNNAQKQATIDAGKIAGLNVLRVLSEPTAAALAYGIQQKKDGEQMVLIFDLGGGTFDVSVIKISNGTSFEVQAVAGDDHLGGEDFDNRLVNHFSKQFTRQFKSDLTNNPRSLQRLRTACERAKRTLSSTMEASIEIDNLYDGHDFSSRITRFRFELLCMDLFESTMAPVAEALSDANLQKHQIDEVVMVGGSTRIPIIQELLFSFFKDRKINFTINPDEAVAYGAAVQAAIMTEVYCSQIQNIQLFDVVPLSLGVKSKGAVMSKIIERNSQVPCKKTQKYVTTIDYQTEIAIYIYEGERYKVEDNNFLGHFEITGLTRALKRLTKVAVTFDLDSDGILTVTAKEVDKNNEKEMKIDKKNGRLTSADVRRMLADAEKYRQIDEKFKEKVEARQELDICISQYERAAASKTTSMDGRNKEKIRKLCAEKSLWLDSNEDADKELIKKQLDELKNAFYELE